MKRTFIIALALLVLFAAFPHIQTASAALLEEVEIRIVSSEYDLQVTEPSLEEYADGTGKFTAQVGFDASVSGTELQIAVAFYSAEGQMLDCWVKTHTLTEGSPIEMEGTVPDYDKVSVFFFEKDSLRPIRPSIIRMLENQVTGNPSSELLTAIETRLSAQEAALAEMRQELDDLLNTIPVTKTLSTQDGHSTVTDAGASTSARSVRTSIIGWSTYMTKDIMFGDGTYIEGIILRNYNIEAVQGVEQVEVEIQLRNFDETNGTNLVGKSVLIKSYTATVVPQGISDYHLCVHIDKSDLSSLNDEFLLGLRTINTTMVRMEAPDNSSCVMKAKNDEKLTGDTRWYKYVGYYNFNSNSTTPCNSTSTSAPDFFFSTSCQLDYSNVSLALDTTLTQAGQAADAKAVGDALASLSTTSPDTATLQLPESYDLVVGDTFELFYKGILNSIKPELYDFELRYLSGPQSGSSYARKYVYTPTEAEVGTRTLEITVRDSSGNLVDRQTVTINIWPRPQSPQEETIVLCMGDSLTAGGYWPSELYRRLTNVGGTPEGLGLTNLKFIGTKTLNNAHYEGTGGWTYGMYLGESSPFWNAEKGEIDFAAYAAKQGVTHIDHLFILLGWNQTTSSEQSYKAGCRALLDKLYEAFPDCQVSLLGLQVLSRDGCGAKAGISWKYYDQLQFVWSHQNWCQELCDESAYSGKLSYINISGQFDTDYNMPQQEVPANLRSTQTEIVQNNHVHPTTSGYYQIADAVFRHFCGKLQ